ncbi:thiamine-monophosphate kinase [Methanolacinia petrolearia DSM 11571]|uniref:Thiamine-monophosphate kinase n=1 Tax=Methanolacinia petrolearia (strain DSM 11571 / OCM 486 / SEBR 4847) TaxID=679926 RepID=E1RFM8_METP4|nr:thiamine-phosphate kinase [Methanolacinia petrolearia]ADN37332.1 thiamine-monophosphate kinase [Methanolacinia petrolearia DSM 11571]
MDDRELLRSIAGIVGREKVLDDCASYPLGSKMIVASTDMLHESTDFPKGMTDRQIGWMSAAVTISDIASSGAAPLFILVAVGLDRPERLEGIMKGASECCEFYETEIRGGDIDSHDELTVVTTGFGIADEDCYITRSGCSPGDLVYILGNPGEAQAALEGDIRYWLSLVEPHPFVSEALLIAKAGASAMMDVSDGLALSLYDLADASGTGFEILAERIPLSPGVISEQALYGGGDFGLLFTCDPGMMPVPEVEAVCIGRVIDSPGVFLDGAAVERRGYLHRWEHKEDEV